MRIKWLPWLFMFLVIVYLKDGEVNYYNDATSYYVHNSNGAWGGRDLFLEIMRKGEQLRPDKIASYNWDVVKYVEKK